MLCCNFILFKIWHINFAVTQFCHSQPDILSFYILSQNEPRIMNPSYKKKKIIAGTCLSMLCDQLS